MRKFLFISLIFFGCTTTKRTVIDATRSFDPDGWIAGDKLEQISGAKAVIKEIGKLKYEIIAPKGVYEFRFTLTDNDSAKATRVIQKTNL